jgi:hypothetical protein
MSFDAIYYPGIPYDPARIDKVLEDYRKQIFTQEGDNPAEEPPPGGDEPGRVATDSPAAEEGPVLPATAVGRAVWHTLVNGGFDELASRYVFDARPLTNDRPYFAAYVKPQDLPKIVDRLDLFQDEWGYLLLWATLAIAAIAAFSLVLFPVVAGWRTIFSHYPGKFGTIIYFACLGAGYIMVEVGLIAHFILALSNATVSASILITGMLVFSGLGALVSERFVPNARRAMPVILGLIGALLIAYGFLLDRPLDWIGTFPYGWRVLFCFLLIAPPAFLMGFPMPIGMTSLARLGKTHMFLWAWGINGCFSVLGAAMVPLIATAFGLSTVLVIAGGAYLLAIPALFALLLPLAGKWAAHAAPQPA